MKIRGLVLLWSLLLTGCYKAEYQEASAKIDALTREVSMQRTEIARLQSTLANGEQLLAELRALTREVSTQRAEIDLLKSTVASGEKLLAEQRARERQLDERKIKSDLRAAIALQRDLSANLWAIILKVGVDSILGKEIGGNPAVAAWKNKFKESKRRIIDLTRIDIDAPMLEEIATAIRVLPDDTNAEFDKGLGEIDKAVRLVLNGDRSAATTISIINSMPDKTGSISKREEALANKLE